MPVFRHFTKNFSHAQGRSQGFQRQRLFDIAAGAGIGLAVILLCFGNLLFSPAALLCIPFYVRYQESRRQEAHRRQLQGEFKNASALLYSSTAAGATLEKAIRDTLISMRTTPARYELLIPEFERIVLLLERNVPMEKALAQFAHRCQDEDIRDFVRVLQIAGRRGGQLCEIVENTSRAVSLRMEINQQIRTLLAGRSQELKIMAIIPAGILIYMNLSSPEYMSVLYQTSVGHLLMTGALAAYLAALVLGRKILDVHI